MATDIDQPFLDQTPPPLVARGLALVLLSLFVVTAVAMVAVRVPEAVPARFVLVPINGTDPVRTLHDGIVTEVRVVDAQRVEAGAVLFTIGSESVGDRTAEREGLVTRLSGGAQRLANERERYESQRRADDEAARRLQERLPELEAQVVLIQRQASLAREVAERQQKSFDEGLISWLEASKPRLEADRLAAEAEQVRSSAAEVRAAAARLRFEMASRRAAFEELSRSVEEELTRARTRQGLLDTEPSRNGNNMTVTAPCGGTIVKLLVRSPGTAVHEFDPLAEIACGNERMQAELLVPQRGLARVTEGQPVKLRYDAFPYGRYGVRFATLQWISPAASGTTSGDAFRALANLDEQSIEVEGTTRQLFPGMSGDASVIVGRRTLVSYVFEPLRAARERLSAERPANR